MFTPAHTSPRAEVESALLEHPGCAEAAVVPTNHPIKGQAIYAFVTMMEGYCTYPPENSKLKDELVAAVRKAIGAIATPDVIHWVGAGGQGEAGAGGARNGGRVNGTIGPGRWSKDLKL